MKEDNPMPFKNKKRVFEFLFDFLKSENMIYDGREEIF